MKVSKVDFVTEMYAWYIHGMDGDEICTKSLHLKHKPSIEDVQEVKQLLVMGDV